MLPTTRLSCFFCNNERDFLRLGMRPPKPRNCRNLDGGSLMDWLRRLEGIEYTELTLLCAVCLRYGFDAGPDLLPLILAMNMPTLSGIFFSLSGIFKRNPPWLSPFSFVLRSHFPPVLRLRRQRKSNALMAARPTKPPTTPPTTLATFVVPPKGRVSPLLPPAVP